MSGGRTVIWYPNWKMLTFQSNMTLFTKDLTECSYLFPKVLNPLSLFRGWVLRSFVALLASLCKGRQWLRSLPVSPRGVPPTLLEGGSANQRGGIVTTAARAEFSRQQQQQLGCVSNCCSTAAARKWTPQRRTKRTPALTLSSYGGGFS